MAGTRSEMNPLLPKQYSRVLEIGCAEGDFRKNLSQEHEYWGVEPNKSAASIASYKLDKILLGTYEEKLYQILDDYFDLVICNDVIEHMIDYNQFFTTIKKKLKRNGTLVASIPNVRHLSNLFNILVKKDWEYTDEGILDRTHLRFFTEKSLKRAIKNNGFIIEEFIGINPSLGSKSLKSYLLYPYIVLFGQDVRFWQFGIRIRYLE